MAFCNLEEPFCVRAMIENFRFRWKSMKIGGPERRVLTTQTIDCNKHDISIKVNKYQIMLFAC
jgi:hypothetical protein